jgi:hypothetical protein
MAHRMPVIIIVIQMWQVMPVKFFHQAINKNPKFQFQAIHLERGRRCNKLLSPPTAMGLPRNRASADCSTETKNASASKWIIAIRCSYQMDWDNGCPC